MYVTALVHMPAAVVVLILPAHSVKVGITQPTVTVNEQVDVLPLASVAVAVTVVVPTGKKVFGAWL